MGLKKVSAGRKRQQLEVKKQRLGVKKKTTTGGNKKSTGGKKKSNGGKKTTTTWGKKTTAGNKKQNKSRNKKKGLENEPATNSNSSVPLKSSSIGKTIKSKYRDFLKKHPEMQPELDRLDNKLAQLEADGAAKKLIDDAKAELKSYEGKMYEKHIQERFEKKITNKNEDIMDSQNPNRVDTEIDFETSESLYQVKINPVGHVEQFRKTLRIAIQRGKKLTIVYDPTNVSLRQLADLKKAFNDPRVIYLPLTP